MVSKSLPKTNARASLANTFKYVVSTEHRVEARLDFARLDFRVTSCTKLLARCYDVTVKFSLILKGTFGQLTAEQQNIKLGLASLF